VKLCKDCRWAESMHGSLSDYWCNQPLLQRPPYINQVTGEQRRPRWLCDTERHYPGGKCGPDGDLWEPKDAGSAKPGFV
jgi:hypothetical protein